MSLINTLRQTIPNIAQSSLDELTNCWTKKVELKRNEYLVKKRTNHPYLYFVEKGAVHIYYPGDEKDESFFSSKHSKI